jgi:hypothetical protein
MNSDYNLYYHKDIVCILERFGKIFNEFEVKVVYCSHEIYYLLLMNYFSHDLN